MELDKAIAEWLKTLTAKWSEEIDWSELSSTDQEALKSLQNSGLVEEKGHTLIESERGAVRFEQQRNGCCDERTIKAALFKSLPWDWLAEKGALKDHCTISVFPLFRARLTVDGVQAKADFLSSKPSFVFGHIHNSRLPGRITTIKREIIPTKIEVLPKSDKKETTMDEKGHSEFLTQAATRIAGFKDRPAFEKLVNDFGDRWQVWHEAYAEDQEKAIADPTLRTDKWKHNREYFYYKDFVAEERAGFELIETPYPIEVDGKKWNWYRPIEPRNPLDCLLPDWWKDIFKSNRNDQTSKRRPVDQDEYLACSAMLLAVVYDRWGHGTKVFPDDTMSEYWRDVRDELIQFYGLMDVLERFDRDRERYCGAAVRTKITEALNTVEKVVTATDEPQEKSADDYTISKSQTVWTFYYNSKNSMIPAGLKGLRLLEILLTHPNNEYHPNELLRAAGFRGEGDIESSDPKSDPKTIEQIRYRMTELRQKEDPAGDPSEQAEVKEEIEKLEKYLISVTNIKGSPRKIGDAGRKRVENLLRRVYEKADLELRKHFETFATPGTILSYRPDRSIRWTIS